MATPTVAINNGTGSDTAASGAGPATALTGTAASFASTTVTLDGSPDLTGVATDGSHVLWLKTSTGRQFSAITGADNGAKTVTVADAPAGTSTGRTWAIGGKRATLDHVDTRHLFADAKLSWVVDLQQTGTDYTLTSALPVSVVADRATPFTFKSSSVTRPVITSSTTTVNLLDVSSAQYLTLRHLALTHTGATRGRGIVPVTANVGALVVDDCLFDGVLRAIEADNVTFFASSETTVTRCEAKNCTSDAFRVKAHPRFQDCYIHDNAGIGIATPSNSNPASFTVRNCVITTNTGKGISCVNSGANADIPYTFDHNTVANNGSDGLSVTPTQLNLTVTNNIFYGNGTGGTGRGVDVVTAGQNAQTVHTNAYGANATAASQNLVDEQGAVTLTASPFVSGSDWGLNATAGGGAACKAAAASAPNASANAAGDLGAVPSGGGVGASTDPGVANVKSGTAYTINGSSLTGTLTVPAPSAGGMRGGFTNG